LSSTRRLDRSLDDPYADRGEHRIERRGEAGIRVPDQELEAIIRRSRARMRCDYIRSRTDRTNLRADSSRFYFLVVR